MPRIGAFKRPRMSADEPSVKIWKLRAIVYGLLVGVAALVLAARPSAPSEGPIRNLRTLHGTTAQSSSVTIAMRGRHVRTVDVDRIAPHCARSIWWHPTVGRRGVYYHEHGEQISVEEWWDPERAIMYARVYNGGHNVDGTIGYAPSRNCNAGTIRFSASG
jgi:hypothetical protein